MATRAAAGAGAMASTTRLRSLHTCNFGSCARLEIGWLPDAVAAGRQAHRHRPDGHTYFAVKSGDELRSRRHGPGRRSPGA